MGILPKVEVLLATYNGEQFVRQQIDSLLNQDYGNLSVLARDDGSSDGTQEVLKGYAERFPDRFRVLASSSSNGGIWHNFLSLMKASTADYVCFCDQDDVWLREKVSKTKRVMDKVERQWGAQMPTLVFTDLTIVDEGLVTVHPSFWACMGIDPERIDNFVKLLGSSVVTGCTVMANRRLIELGLRMPKEACLHDRWMSLLVSTMGKADFVPEPTVLYRQHGGNAIGAGKEQSSKSLREQFGWSVVRSHVGEWQSNQEQAGALLRVHGTELPAARREELEAFIRCETSPSRLVRVTTFLGHRFYSRGLLARIVVPLYLWLRQKPWTGSMER